MCSLLGSRAHMAQCSRLQAGLLFPPSGIRQGLALARHSRPSVIGLLSSSPFFLPFPLLLTPDAVARARGSSSCTTVLHVLFLQPVMPSLTPGVLIPKPLAVLASPRRAHAWTSRVYHEGRDETQMPPACHHLSPLELIFGKSPMTGCRSQ